ncbi:hypothetical protein ACN4EK_28765 [Pantanalinema rosaneae CENA516]
MIDRQFTMMRSPNRASFAPVHQEIFHRMTIRLDKIPKILKPSRHA